MTRYSWESSWNLKYTLKDGQNVQIPAKVPGNVLADIVRANLEKDPFLADNSLEFRKYDYIDFEYITTFVTPEFLFGERVELVFSGVDTIAEYFLDGKSIYKSNNMFVEQHIDITDYTSPLKQHILSVKLQSAVNYARNFTPSAHVRAQDYNYEAVYLRKARHSFGWDIFPRLPGAGIWRPVFIDVKRSTEWNEVYLRTITILPEGALFYLNWSFSTNEEELDDFSAEIILTCKEQTFIHQFTPRFVCGKTYFYLPNPKLWWPVGSGEQNIYDVELKLFLHKKIVSVKKFHTAARTILLDYKETAQGAEQDNFNFIVNGKKIYIRGLNHVPVDALHGENANRRFQALEAALDLHCNMIRIWGGGVYEDDDFYDWCDIHGMLVWQDFMFACECPPQDEWFLRDVENEAIAIIKKLRNHPSLALFCGDNECDVIHRGSSPYLPPSHNKITRLVLPEAVGEHSPEVAYIPSSPFISDEVWKSPTKYLSPELHPWGDRYDWKSNYYHDAFRCCFISEIGYPGINNLSSLKQYIPENDLNITAIQENRASWHTHATAPFAAEHPSFSFRVNLPLKLVERTFGSFPASFEEFVDKSQIVHAEAMKTFVEQFRVNRNSKGGLMLWNLMDGWPQYSEALIDYYNERKKAYEYVKQASQELCLILPEPTSWRATPVIVNDLSTSASGYWKIFDLANNELLIEGNYSIAGNSCSNLMWFEHRPKAMQMLLLEWSNGNKIYYNHALIGNAPYDYNFYVQNMNNYVNILKNGH